MRDFNNYLQDIQTASKKGANEDIIHVSKNDDGYDLRDANDIGSKQSFDQNDNA